GILDAVSALQEEVAYVAHGEVQPQLQVADGFVGETATVEVLPRLLARRGPEHKDAVGDDGVEDGSACILPPRPFLLLLGQLQLGELHAGDLRQAARRLDEVSSPRCSFAARAEVDVLRRAAAGLTRRAAPA